MKNTKAKRLASTARRGTPARSSRTNVNRLYDDVLMSIMLFMMSNHLSAKAAKRAVLGAHARADILVRTQRLKRKQEPHSVGAVLHEWFRNPSFLDEDLKPRALRKYGSTGSIEALARASGAGASAAVLVRGLARLELIRKVGRSTYVPVDRVATIRSLTPELVAHVAESMSSLLETVQHNVTQPTRNPSLIERRTFVLNLPIELLEEFGQYTQEQGSAFLANLDDWLESRSLRGKARLNPTRVAKAGVHLFAFHSQEGVHSVCASKPLSR